MQLKNRSKRLREVGTPLAAATYALLGPAGLASKVSAQELMPWDIDTSLLIYNESDGRVRPGENHGWLHAAAPMLPFWHP